MALLQRLTAIVPGALDQLVILQHLLRHEFWQEALVCVRIDLHELRLLARNLGELIKNLRGGVVALCTEYTGTEDGRPVLDDGFDEFAWPALV
jgi:hypothetical protein